MQVHGRTSWRIDLHVAAQLIAEEMPVIGGDNDGAYTQVAQDAERPPQFMQHLVHRPTGQRHVVALAEGIDLLRRDQDQIRFGNALSHPLFGTRQQILEFRVDDGDARLFPQKSDPILTLLEHRALHCDGQPVIPGRDDGDGFMRLWEEGCHPNFRDGRHCSKGRIHLHLEIFRQRLGEIARHFEAQRIDPHIRRLPLDEFGLHPLREDLPLLEHAGEAKLRGVIPSEETLGQRRSDLHVAVPGPGEQLFQVAVAVAEVEVKGVAPPLQMPVVGIQGAPGTIPSGIRIEEGFGVQGRRLQGLLKPVGFQQESP